MSYLSDDGFESDESLNAKYFEAESKCLSFAYILDDH